jgi:hypothetical protein
VYRAHLSDKHKMAEKAEKLEKPADDPMHVDVQKPVPRQRPSPLLLSPRSVRLLSCSPVPSPTAAESSRVRKRRPRPAFAARQDKPVSSDWLKDVQRVCSTGKGMDTQVVEIMEQLHLLGFAPTKPFNPEVVRDHLAHVLQCAFDDGYSAGQWSTDGLDPAQHVPASPPYGTRSTTPPEMPNLESALPEARSLLDDASMGTSTTGGAAAASSFAVPRDSSSFGDKRVKFSSDEKHPHQPIVYYDVADDIERAIAASLAEFPPRPKAAAAAKSSTPVVNQQANNASM